ncbi:HU family DNA-binding protein [Catalinimonas niigatensis]|uniref:HU family DNA-binding protein n=1 Tax=Catalinimonas niigatensis TaxID=1397264 RepID=UPI002666E152|nr:DNA-binding domain-containing protein [Catalinimonas niigatensis]WPP48352.1 DNA-binding domain-containing protein [Catalinimonas niigatensis]
MPIRFALYRNPFKKNKEERVARVLHRACAGDEEVVKMILLRNSGLTRSEVMAVLEEYTVALEYLLKDGQSVHTSLIKLEASIKGKFRDENDRFDPKRHKVCLNASPGKRLRKLLDREKAYRQEPSSPQPYIEGFQHFDSQLPAHHFLPGIPVRLSGSYLKINPEKEDEGIYLKAANNKLWKISQLVTNFPGELLFMMPEGMPAGTYQLEVRCRVGNSTELRSDTYRHALICSPSAASE